MAGIGFELNKLLKKNSFLMDIVSIFYSANVSAGPWIMCSLTLFLLILLLPRNETLFFTSAVVYSFIFSTLLFGGVSISVTRYLADLIYRKEFSKMYELYSSTVLYAVLSSGVFLTIFSLISRIDDWFKLLLFSYSLVVLTVVWVQTIFVTTMMVFTPVLVAFAAGNVLGLVMSVQLFKIKGENFAYLGYNFGLMFILFFLHVFVKRYLYTGRKPTRSLLFWQAIRRFKSQAITGVLTYLGAWVDDFVAWIYIGKPIVKGFVFAPSYDIPMFLSYLFIIPTLTLFVLSLETNFYLKYRMFYQSLEENRTLNYVKINKRILDDNISSTTKTIFAVQFVFVLLGLTLSGYIAKMLQFDEYSLKALRFGILGAAANGAFLYVSLLAYYFDLAEIPMRSAMMAFVVNLVVSLFYLRTFPALGFLVGFSVATLYGWLSFKRVYKDLLHFEFIRREIGIANRQVIVHENVEE